MRAVIPLSSDHDLEREDEVVRIKQSPGQIVESRAGNLILCSSLPHNIEGSLGIKRLRPTALSPQEMIAKRLGLGECEANPVYRLSHWVCSYGPVFGSSYFEKLWR